MSIRSRIRLTIDADNRILIIRLSDREDRPDAPDMIDHIRAAGAPWLYDAIIDFRRYAVELSRDHLAFLTQKWRELEQGRDTHGRLALVTADPALKARLIGLKDVMPDRPTAIFDTFDEALDWVKQTVEI